MVGPHYAFQLEHQIDKKSHVRHGGMPGSIARQVGAPVIHYDGDTKVPRGGGHHGAQSLGSMGIYGALAAGLNNNLREMQTLKSDQAQALEVWGALNSGDRIPAPKVPFVYEKFKAMLTTMGVDVRKEGAEVRLVPRTDAETRALSRGEIKKPNLTIRGKDDEPEKGGLFDRTVTGGPAGTHWGHIELVEPMPNPVYSKAIALTLGLDARFPDKSILKELQTKGKGPRAFHERLKKIDLDKELAATKKALQDPKVKGSQLDKMNFKYKALKTIKDAGKHPSEVWSMKAVPVMPPAFRPQGTLPDGTLKNNPLNDLYKRVGMLNLSLQKSEGRVPYQSNLDARAAMFEELQNLFGTTPKGKKVLDNDSRSSKKMEKGKPLPGIIHMMSGDQPKDGFFQDKMIGKKQDYTSRATIVADPNLSVDEIGVPRKIALELYRPFVARRLMAVTQDPLKANKMISQKDPMAIKALEKELEDRPVLMKRDPVLHQYGLVGQRVKLTKSPAIKVSPLILPPIGGDVDGDQVALMVPLSQESVEEARRVMPSQRPLSDSSGDVLFKPANESSLALYRMSLPRGNKRALKFKDQKGLEKAFQENKVALNDVVQVAGVGQTTLGRMRIAKIVPDEYKKEVLTDLKSAFTKKKQAEILKKTAKERPKHFVQLADNMSRLGFKMAYESGHTVTLADLEPLREQRGALTVSYTHLRAHET